MVEVTTKKSRINAHALIVVNIVAFVLMFVMSSLYHFIRDDLVMMHNPITGELNVGVMDCAISAWYYYFHWTGKCTPVRLLQKLFFTGVF